MAVDVRPPETHSPPPPPTHQLARAEPPPPEHRTNGLYAFIGFMSLGLMALMLLTNFFLQATGGMSSVGARPAAAPAQPAAADVARSTGNGPAAFTVAASEFKFAPSELQMGGAGDLTVTLRNTGQVEHDFVVEGFAGRILARPGQTASGTINISRPGQFVFVCSIPGHKEAGMKGQLIVGQPLQSSAKPAAPAAYGGAPQEASLVVEPPVAVKPAAAGAKPLPLPAVAPPTNRSAPQLVKVELETREVTAQMADGVTYRFWTFNGSVPGPMIRVRQGDTVEVTMKNAPDSQVTHSVDLHAVTGPGGGAKVTQVPAGGSATFSFKALNPGVYVYHCATPMVAHHIGNGMYGLIVVEPEGGFPKVDREFYVMQGDFYLSGERGKPGHHDLSMEKMLREQPEHVVFNGGVGQLTGANALKAQVGETVRIFFGVGGPNLASSFHVIGEIFDRVHPEGSAEAATHVQTTLVPAGGATMVDFRVDYPGTYVLVDHSLGRLEKGAAGQLVVEGPENADVFKVIHAGEGGGGGH